jgi:hypothetical protein
MRAPSLITALTVSSAAWLGAALWIGWSAHARSPAECSVLDGTFACLTANELGDFLAGVFAPLAFFWLAAAVYIQREELRATKDELVITRNVMTAQVDEAKKQAGFIGLQTDILTQQENSARRRRHSTIFDQVQRDLALFIRVEIHGKAFIGGTNNSGAQDRIYLAIPIENDAQLIRDFGLFIQNEPGKMGLQNIYIDRPYMDAAYRTAEMLNILLDNFQKAESHYTLAADRMMLGRSYRRLLDLINAGAETMMEAENEQFLAKLKAGTLHNPAG